MFYDRQELINDVYLYSGYLYLFCLTFMKEGNMKKKVMIAVLGCFLGCMLIAGCGKKKDGPEVKPDEKAGSVQQEEAPSKDGDETPEDEEKKPEKKLKDTGKAPAILRHRGYEHEHNSNGQLTINHHYSYISLGKQDAGSNKGLASSLEKARDDIKADEEAKRKKEEETLKENELYSFEENWDTYVRRADGCIISFVTEYVAVGAFDGQYYSEYKAHNYYTDSGEEIGFEDVIADEDAFFDLLAGRLSEYYEYAKKNIYQIDNDTDKDQIRDSVKDYMKEGSCAWTVDPQGVTFFLNSYTGLPEAVSATVLFSEDKEGKIFNEEFVESARDEWIMQVPQHVGSYCDTDDDGEAELIRAYAVEEMKQYEGSEEYYISGLKITCDSFSHSFRTRMTGGTDFYDVFFMHKDHGTGLIEGHYEYDSAFINTYTLDKDSIDEADAVRGMFEGSDEEMDDEKEDHIPCFIPTDLSKIRVKLEEDSEAREMTNDILSIGPKGKIEIRYGEYEHVPLGVNEAVDETGAGVGRDIEPFFGLWVGSFKDKNEAQELVSKLKDKGLDAYYVYSPEWENLNKEPYYCVTIGESGSEPEAQDYIADAAKEGFKDAYVKYTGSRLSHRICYYLHNESDMEISPDEVVIRYVTVEDLSGGTNSVATLIVDKDTVFDKSCDTQYFGNYRKGDSVLEWFNYNKELMDTDVDKYLEKGPALKGVFDVSVTGNHIDAFYGTYWWD